VPALPRRVLAELVGTAILTGTVVGSGIAATRLSPGDAGLQLLENTLATVLALGVAIVVLGPVSGAHLNPVVSLADWWLGRRTGTGLTARDAAAYAAAQVAGAVGGAVLANLMYALPPVSWSTTYRTGPALWLGELVATAGLVVVAFALTRTGRTTLTPFAVSAWIGAAYWFTSSTSFANPAVTLGRTLSDTFAGIAPASVPAFVLAQLVATAFGVGLVAALYPAAPPAASPGYERIPRPLGGLR
jgi:glycerol uptake facilitator-like aquaporin